MDRLLHCAWLEPAVLLFQIAGIAALFLHRLLPASRWARRGRFGLVVALIGLGLAGAIVGRHDSEFGLFAGGTMAVMLVGMISGSSPGSAASPTATRIKPGLEPLSEFYG
jgi:hypothetical protein